MLRDRSSIYKMKPIILLLATLIAGIWLRHQPLHAAENELTTKESPASAADVAPPKSWAREFLERDYLLGDWGGLRTALSERGVDLEFFYLGAVPSNVDGGIKRGSVYQGALLMTLD